jgi:hypothetical protein
MLVTVRMLLLERPRFSLGNFFATVPYNYGLTSRQMLFPCIPKTAAAYSPLNPTRSSPNVKNNKALQTGSAHIDFDFDAIPFEKMVTSYKSVQEGQFGILFGPRLAPGTCKLEPFL